MPQSIFHSFGLNIRQKVLLSMVVAIVGFGALGSISYHYLIKIDGALRQAEVVDDLMNDILEIRRYEKNYLLYAQDEDFRESMQYADRVAAFIDQIMAPEGPDGGLPAYNRDFALLRERLTSFRQAFEALVASPDASVAPAPAVSKIRPGPRPDFRDEAKGLLRERGKDLVEVSQHIAQVQRNNILRIVSALKRQLLLSILGMLGLGLAFAWLVGFRIISALLLIERSTKNIARGDFSPLPVPDSRDETRNVVQAFNSMIVELDKRQNQLLQEKKLASLGVLTSGIAHQLNNPLNNISTSCQILREEGLAEDPDFARRMLDNIHHEVIRSRDIVKGLLEFSRENEFTLKPVALADLVERSTRLVGSQLPAGISIVQEVQDDLMAPVDAQRMQEVFLNLIINAIQAMEPGPGTITVSGSADPSANQGAGQALIQIRDTGPGIKPEHLGRIFDPFFTLKDVGKGTGLGLSVVFGIVKKHGGSITAESPPGGGAMFSIRLPLGHKAQPCDCVCNGEGA